MKLSSGFVQIYTGNGKGKTTAAIGLTIRALGHGLKIYFAQFMKNYPYGELQILKDFTPNLVLKHWGNDAFVFKKKSPSPQLIKEMQTGLQEALQAMKSLKYDLVILDEVLVSIYFKLFSTEQIIHFVQAKPAPVELILTGRYCPKELMNLADLVTEMKEIKHYFQKGIKARKGIEN